jgi:hypothetical protein
MTPLEPHEWPDMAAAIDSPVEILADDLGLSMEQAERVMAWMQRERCEASLAESARLMHLVLEWLSCSSNGSRVRGMWQLPSGRYFLRAPDEDGLAPAHVRQIRLARVMAVRLLAVIFILAPEMVDGISETEIARRMGVTRALVSHYVTEFSKRFGVIGRGLKSAASRAAFADAQRGNHNRSKPKLRREAAKLL